MPTALSNAADFGAMKAFGPAGPTDEDYALKIGSVIHQTFLVVHDNGAEAAATTAVIDVVITGRRNTPPPPPPVIFRADRPFMFLIRDTHSGTTLFMGRFVVPPASAQP